MVSLGWQGSSLGSPDFVLLANTHTYTHLHVLSDHFRSNKWPSSSLCLSSHLRIVSLAHTFCSSTACWI